MGRRRWKHRLLPSFPDDSYRRFGNYRTSRRRESSNRELHVGESIVGSINGGMTFGSRGVVTKVYVNHSEEARANGWLIEAMESL